MIKKTMKEIKARLKQKGAVTDKSKADLLTLLSKLETEIDKLSKTHSEHAESITGFIERSAHEATRQKKQPQLLKISLSGLSESVKGFEASHPSLVENINEVCTVLANMGV